MPNHKPPYAAAFRQQIVELVKAGRDPKDLAKEFGCHVSSIHNWVGQANAIASPGAAGALNQAEREELIALRRKVRQVEMERDILAKATAWFAHNGDKTSTPSTR